MPSLLPSTTVLFQGRAPTEVNSRGSSAKAMVRVHCPGAGGLSSPQGFSVSHCTWVTTADPTLPQPKDIQALDGEVLNSGVP